MHYPAVMSAVHEWPPAIGATVRSPSGERFLVIARGETPRLGEHVVLRGWQTFPVTQRAWHERRYEIADPEECADGTPAASLSSG